MHTTTTSSYNNGHTYRTTELSPSRHFTVRTGSPLRTVTSTVMGNPCPIAMQHSTHDIDPLGDAIVSYGVDEMGEPVRITSTGILHGHEI